MHAYNRTSTAGTRAGCGPEKAVYTVTQTAVQNPVETTGLLAVLAVYNNRRMHEQELTGPLFFSPGHNTLSH